MQIHPHDWASQSVEKRVQPLKLLRGLLVDNAKSLFDALDSRNTRTFADFVSSEPFALAEACKWHLKHAARVLKSRRVRHLGLNPYLGRMSAEVVREPFGKVLIIGTWNYPVFLTGVQMLQALVAGNAVTIKPAPGAELVTRQLADLFIASGFSASLIDVVDASPQQVDICFENGVDLVVMTASSKTGRIVAAKAAEKLIPVIAELSGCDALFVLPDADLKRVASAILFGLRLNSSATCMAPRRVIVHDAQANQLIELLCERMDELPASQLSSSTAQQAELLTSEAVAMGAVLIEEDSKANPAQSHAGRRAYVLDRVTPEMKVAQVDIFAPMISILRQPSCDLEEWSQVNRRCPYALTASVFGDEASARQLAGMVSAGMVTINDIIATTVEPSLSFGGRCESGFGMTRGEEGLRQMTREKSIVVRRGNFLPHLDPPHPADSGLIAGLFAWLHGKTLRERIRGIRRMVDAVRAKSLPK